MTGFIYVITNDINGKQYVGKTTDTVEVRFKKHLEEYNRPRCEKRPLYAAMNKYGIEHFSVKQLEECDLSILNEREQFWIKQLSTFHFGYNATYGGDGTQLYNYELFIQDYDNGMTGKEIANKYNCDLHTVRNALIKAGRDTNKNAFERNLKSYHAVAQYKDNEMINQFISYKEAARYLIDNNLCESKNIRGVSANIGRCVNQQRSIAYGFKWKLLK